MTTQTKWVNVNFSSQWTDPDNLADGDTGTFASETTNAQWHIGRLTGAQAFAIPINATINGIAVTVQHYEGGPGDFITVGLYHPVEGYTYVLDLPYRSSTTEDTVGGPTEMWGEDWIYEDINDATLGVILQYAVTTGKNVGVYASKITVAVYYTDGPETHVTVLTQGLSLTATGAATAAGMVSKVLVDGFTSAASMNRRFTRRVAQGFGVSGILRRRMFRRLSQSIVAGAILRKDAGIRFAENPSFEASVALTHHRFLSRAITEGISFGAGELRRFTLRMADGVSFLVDVTPGTIGVITKVLWESLGIACAIQKDFSKFISDKIGISDVLSRAMYIRFEEVLGLATDLSRAMHRKLLTSITLVGIPSISKSGIISKVLLEPFTVVTELFKDARIRRITGLGVGTTPGFSKLARIITSETVSISDGLSRAMHTRLLEPFHLAANLSRAIHRRLTSGFTLVGTTTLTGAFRVVLEQSFSLACAMRNDILLRALQTLSMAGSISKGIYRRLWEGTSLEDHIARAMHRRTITGFTLVATSILSEVGVIRKVLIGGFTIGMELAKGIQVRRTQALTIDSVLSFVKRVAVVLNDGFGLACEIRRGFTKTLRQGISVEDGIAREMRRVLSLGVGITATGVAFVGERLRKALVQGFSLACERQQGLFRRLVQALGLGATVTAQGEDSAVIDVGWLGSYPRGSIATLVVQLLRDEGFPLASATVTADITNALDGTPWLTGLVLKEGYVPGTYKATFRLKRTDPMGTYPVVITARKGSVRVSSITYEGYFMVYAGGPRIIRF